MPTGPDVTPVLFGFVGRSGAGKTTLITDVINCLRLDGFTVSAMLHEYLSEPEPDPRALAQRMAGVDIVLFEGFRNAAPPTLEVFRPSLGRPMLWPVCPSVIAVATDGDVTCPLPVLNLAAPQAITAFITGQTGLRTN